MIPEVSIDFVFNKGQKKNLVWRCLFFGIIHLDKDIYQDYEGRMRCAIKRECQVYIKEVAMHKMTIYPSSTRVPL